MMELFKELLPGGFLFWPFLAGLVGSFSFGVVGSYVYVRKLSYVATAIGHSSIAGIGITYFIQDKTGWLMHPFIGGAFFTILMALFIGFCTLRNEEKGDSVISSTMVVSMALGLILLHMVENVQTLSTTAIFFGDIMFVTKQDVIVILWVNAVVIFCGVVFYNKLKMVCFDEEYARLRGVNSAFYYYLLLSIISLSVIAMTVIVGIVLVIALMTLPAVTAALLSKRLWQCMVWASILCLVSVTLGFICSISWDIPTGPCIVLISSALYVFVYVITSVFLKTAKA
ncbi:metal ABC transporter permease [Lentisphaera profundi]|uniref:Metal ABC transporter permease n=1 Tax=Lentisphaera profundi TaxID=1658616 RepID=A0ABY7VVA8_9BACT|nr:metal ABC transporter permease [Lentisphaera profundi]WDE97831.1 metal ABC transporter permease [Lentisphaera profundi]